MFLKKNIKDIIRTPHTDRFYRYLINSMILYDMSHNDVEILHISHGSNMICSSICDFSQHCPTSCFFVLLGASILSVDEIHKHIIDHVNVKSKQLRSKLKSISKYEKTIS